MQVFRKNQEPAVHKLKEPTLDEITNALRRRYELNFTRQDTSSLWYLCKQVIIGLLNLLKSYGLSCRWHSWISPSSVCLGLNGNNGSVCRRLEAQKSFCYSILGSLIYVLTMWVALLSRLVSLVSNSSSLILYISFQFKLVFWALFIEFYMEYGNV